MATMMTGLTAQINSTPFCDKSCKGIRVFSQFLAGSLYSLALLIISVACVAFSKSLASTYLSMAQTEFDRVSRALYTYLKFGDQLIDFSYNGCSLAPASDTEENAIRARYGNEAINHYCLEIETREIPLKREKLERVDRGICFGMSLDFMKQYFGEIQMGNSSIEAIRKISSRYVEGAPDEAQLAHIFYSALHENVQIESDELMRVLENKRQEILQWEEGEIPHQVAQEYEKFKGERLAKLGSIKQMEFKLRAIISKQFRLYSQPVRLFYSDDKLSTDCDPQLNLLLEKLPEGCYQGLFSSRGDSGHAIVLIKSKNEYFIFDPNFGTLAFERNAIGPKLWDLGKSIYRDKPFKVSFCSYKVY